MDELAVNVYRREENAASLALNLEFRDSWLSKHSPEYCESRFCEKEQMCWSRDVLLTFEISIRLSRLPKLHVEAFTDNQIQTAFQ